MKRDKQELMRKVKALAEHGFGGEKENAQKLLKKLIDQYGPLDIEEEKKADHDFRWRDELERNLLLQIIYAVTNCDKFYVRVKTRKLHVYVVKCTDREALEIEAQFEFYNAHLKKELDIFFEAFCNINNLFPKNAKATVIDDMDKERLKKAERMFSMMQGMEVAKRWKMIEA